MHHNMIFRKKQDILRIYVRFFAYSVTEQGGVFLREKIKTFLAVCVLILAAPYIVTLLFQGSETSTEAGKGEPVIEEKFLSQENSDKNKLDEEEYLAGIVAEEISLDSQPEAIKAQAVIARTLLAGALEREEELPESMSREEMLSLWGQDGFEQNYRVLESALTATEGEILVWEDAPIQAAFHAVSAGKTRDAKDALGTEISYLKSVDSSMDIPSHDYLNVSFMEKKDLADRLNESFPDAGLTAEGVVSEIVVAKRDAGEYVLEVEAGKHTMTGEEFRDCLNLNSACFSLKEVEGQVRIVTKGMGHGLGLSQYGANEMAKAGSDYIEILQYYYKDVELKKKS